jgi:ATP-dependent DNA helicase RecQ
MIVALENKLQEHFGYKNFRDKQKDIITNVLDKKDTIVLMPTGGGKSICYQLPSLILPGLTIVVSPLIALMQDQVQALRANGVKAAYLNSSLTYEESDYLMQDLEAGRIKILYVAPERLLMEQFIDFLKKLEISLFAIDEAHCLSSWGHQFRPDYKELKTLRNKFEEVPIIALTATADKTVRKEIGQLLALNNPDYFISSFDRPNLSLAVLPGQKKFEQLGKVLARHAGKCGIIYCLSRKNTEELAKKLRDNGYSAQEYHAGMSSEQRQKTQNDFIGGDLKIVVATVAFGMGIDKSNVRFVVHYNMPGNLEGYYQEIGRAGRDGEPAEAVLFYSYRDVQLRSSFIEDIEDEQQRQIQKAKLDRMKEYAESQICRRQVLLTYFSDRIEENCGNCDVCKNPPRYFDGTVLAQKALSAIKRSEQKLSVTVLIDVLKGTNSLIVQNNNFNQIKTFGAGYDKTVFEWQLFIQQFVQLGLIEIDYKDNYRLKTTTFGEDVLYGKFTIDLITPQTIKSRQQENKEKVAKISSRKKSKTSFPKDDDLYEALRALRKELADKMGKPAFTVFSNATLENMSALQPKTMEDFLEVHGVGQFKAKQFGEKFMKVIREF